MGCKRGRGGNEAKASKGGGGGNKKQGGKGKSNNIRNNDNSSQPRPGFICPVGEKENSRKEKQATPNENATIEKNNIR